MYSIFLGAILRRRKFKYFNMYLSYRSYEKTMNYDIVLVQTYNELIILFWDYIMYMIYIYIYRVIYPVTLEET